MSSPTEMVMLNCGCGAGYPVLCPADRAGQLIRCPWSGTEMHVVGQIPFGREEWERTTRVAQLETCASEFKRSLTPRKHRLAFCGLARIHYTCHRSHWFWDAITVAERWADTGSPGFGVDDLLQRGVFGRGTPARDRTEWAWLAGASLAQNPVYPRDAMPRARASDSADVYRELVSNPFLPLAWNPEWFTSTVRDLAAHIYEAREFVAMPILADALQDAGCDDEQILTHCRANKPHARGCWVLDAILGKE